MLLPCNVIAMTERELLLLGQLRQDIKAGRAREARVAAGFSQAELGEVVGVHQCTIHGWETGRRRPHGEAGVRYARLLDKLTRETTP